MSESETITEHIEPQPQDQDQNPASKPDPQETDPKKIPTFSFSIWPPSQKTRDAVVSRLIETLSTESVLSKRYGTIPRDEASESARRIEEEAFGVASHSTSSASASAEDVDDGIEILQLYSKEISKRMLETVKSRADSGSGNNKEETNASSEPAASEEVGNAVEAEA